MIFLYSFVRFFFIGFLLKKKEKMLQRLLNGRIVFRRQPDKVKIEGGPKSPSC